MYATAGTSFRSNTGTMASVRVRVRVMVKVKVKVKVKVGSLRRGGPPP